MGYKAEALRQKCLKVKTHDLEKTMRILENIGYPSVVSGEGVLELNIPEAVLHPDKVATLLVNSGQSPTMLFVDEEDLETFFLRVINIKGGAK